MRLILNVNIFKDKSYLQKTLLQNAPTIEERAKKAKTGRKAPGTSGRLHRTEAGDWVWSSDEEEFIKDGSGSGSGSAGGSGSGSAGGSSASGSRENTTNNNGSNIGSNINTQNNSNKNDQQTQPIQQAQQAQPITASVVQSQQHPLQQQNEQSNLVNSINLVLRIRNSKKELNDIKFEFTPNKGI